MISIIGRILTLLGQAILTIGGFFLSIIFVFIPTLMLKPQDQIPYIEKDLCIDFPDNYKVKNKQEEWLGFEIRQETTFEFDEDEFSSITKNIDESNCENGKWVESAGKLNFVIDENFPDKGQYTFDAIVSKEAKTLDYKYIEL